MTNRLTRRAALAATLCLPAIRVARAQAVQLRISTAATESDWLARCLVRFKEAVEADLPGQLNISVHPTSSLFRQGTEVPALQRGNLEMSTMTTFEAEQQIPALGPYSAGYVMRDHRHMRAVLGGPLGQEFTAEVAARMGIQIIETIYLGTRQLNLRQPREVRGPADLAGVRLRMPPGPGWVALARGLGATPTPMPNPEVYLALRSGTIDGQENPLGLMRANNFHEVTQQVVLTSHMVQPVFFAVAKPWWDRLAARQQEVLRARAREAAAWNDENRLREEGEIVGFLRGAGLRVVETDRAAFQRSVEAQYRESGIAARWAPGLAQRIVETAA